MKAATAETAAQSCARLVRRTWPDLVAFSTATGKTARATLTLTVEFDARNRTPKAHAGIAWQAEV